MTKLRNTLALGVVVVGAIGAGASIYVVHAHSADAARALIAVQAGTVVALGIAVVVLMSATVKRIDELVEALRALARGEKHARVDAAHFAGLADVARGVNEVAASLCENDDPNLGPVQKRTRERPPVVESPEPRKSKSDPPQPRAGRAERVERPPLRAAGESLSDHPEIGEVRVRKKEPPKEPPKPPSTPPAATPTVEPAALLAPPVETQAPSTKPPSTKPSSTKPSSSRPAAASDLSSNDTVIEPASEPADAHAMAAEPAAEPPAEPPAEPEVQQFPATLELQALFAEFVKEKKAAGHEDVDVDFAAFEETILGECERLLIEHGCRGVRFEVAVGDGDVSLRPRLLR